MSPSQNNLFVPSIGMNCQELWRGTGQKQFIRHFTRFARQYGLENLAVGYNPSIHCWRIVRVLL